MERPGLSFEFFPPKTDKAREGLIGYARELSALRPSFMTVTYGAAGSTRDGTIELCSDLSAATGQALGSHLTYFGATRADLFDYADRLWARNIRHIVALRGDIPLGTDPHLYGGPDYFHFTSDFVEALLARHPFDISVGAYPEKHPDAPSLDADILALEKKCAAGASRAITQFFFDNSTYYRFLDKTSQAGLSTPIVPGLMPLSDYAKVFRFASQCGAVVPDSIRARFEGLDPASDEAFKIALDLLTHQISDLVQHRVPHLHFYTLNRARLPLEACLATGLSVK